MPRKNIITIMRKARKAPVTRQKRRIRTVKTVPKTTPPIVVNPTTVIQVHPGPSHGVSGYPILGQPSNFGYYTPSGPIIPTANPSGSRLGVQSHTPQPVNTFTPATHTPERINLFPDPSSNITEPALPISVGVQATTPPSSDRHVRFEHGYSREDPVTKSMIDFKSEYSPRDTLHPDTSSTTPVATFVTPNIRTGGHVNEQGTHNLWQGGAAVPQSNHDYSSIASHNTPQLINESQSATGTHPSFATPTVHNPVAQGFQNLANEITEVLNSNTRRNRRYSTPVGQSIGAIFERIEARLGIPTEPTLPPAAPAYSRPDMGPGIPGSTSYTTPSVRLSFE